MQGTDDFTFLKLEILKLNNFFVGIRQEIIYMLLTNSWILEDMNLYESFCHLQEMIEGSYQDLNDFVQEINYLETCSESFLIEDLKDELEYIRETIYLEASYITNMVDYMCIIDDYTLSPMELKQRLNDYNEKDFCCYEQVKINRKQLKELQKERRDYFE